MCAVLQQNQLEGLDPTRHQYRDLAKIGADGDWKASLIGDVPETVFKQEAYALAGGAPELP